MNATESVNRWRDAEWALRYLADRDSIPHRAEGRQVLMEVVPDRVTRVLDLGTGDGDTLGRVLAIRPDATGVGLDFQEEMLRRARERFAGEPGVEILEHDLDRPLPAGIGRFDLVVSSFAIHHCEPERQRALYEEVFAVLEPGGRFANLEHVDSPTPELHEEFLGLLGLTLEQDDPSNKLVHVGTHLAWLEQIGFEAVDLVWKWRELALVTGKKPH